MRPTPSSWARTNARERNSESGVALLELLIYTALVLVVIGATLTSLQSVTSAQVLQTDRSTALASMRATLNRMAKELRQASSVDTSVSSASVMTFNTYLESVQHTLTYRASGTQLTRAIDGGTAVPVLKNLSSTQIFTTITGGTAQDVQWIGVQLRVLASKGVDSVLALDSEVNLRNRTAALGGSA